MVFGGCQSNKWREPAICCQQSTEDERFLCPTVRKGPTRTGTTSSTKPIQVDCSSVVIVYCPRQSARSSWREEEEEEALPNSYELWQEINSAQQVWSKAPEHNCLLPFSTLEWYYCLITIICPLQNMSFPVETSATYYCGYYSNLFHHRRHPTVKCQRDIHTL